jgi:hypothetical protein
MRKPLLPGRDEKQQLEITLGLIGTPTGNKILKIQNPELRK